MTEKGGAETGINRQTGINAPMYNQRLGGTHRHTQTDKHIEMAGKSGVGVGVGLIV